MHFIQLDVRIKGMLLFQMERAMWTRISDSNGVRIATKAVYFRVCYNPENLLRLSENIFISLADLLAYRCKRYIMEYKFYCQN